MRAWPRRLVDLAGFFGIASWRDFIWVASGWSAIIGLFAVQYSVYGFARYLGWDTSAYVGQAHDIQLQGFGAVPFQNGYPNLYFVLVWILEQASPQIGFAERILPVMMGLILVALYYRFGKELSDGGGSSLAGVAAILAAVSTNTMRLMSDLHRNLFCLIMVYSILLLVIDVHRRRRTTRSTFPLLVVAGALGAFAQIETYAVVLVIVVAYSLTDLRSRWPLSLAVVLPVVVTIPFMARFYLAYPRLAFAPDPADPGMSYADLLYFHGGTAPLLVLAALGVVVLCAKVRAGHFAAGLLLAWYAVLMSLVGILWAFQNGPPAYRPLYLAPIPLLVALGARGTAIVSSRGLELFRTRYGRLRLVPGGAYALARVGCTASIAFLVVMAAIVGLASQKDLYMQPFISEQQYLELEEAGRALLPYAGSHPILVFAGYNGTWYYSMEEAYLEAWTGEVLGYFGRPQYLLTLSDPQTSQPELPNSPDPSRFVAGRLYQDLKASIGSPTDLASHPIVVATPGLYDRPLSDYFVLKHRVSSDLYIVLPGEVTPPELDTWVWFGAYDWYHTSGFSVAVYPWTVAPRALVYAEQTLTQPWDVSYYMNLSADAHNVTLSVHLLDTPPFPSQWNITASSAGGFTILLDNTAVSHYQFADQGVRWANFAIGNLTSGPHTITLQAGDLGKPFALGLDSVALYPEGMSLGTILAAYTGLGA